MENGEFWVIRGNQLFDKQKFEDALISYKLALKIVPRSIRAKEGLAAALGALDKHDEALKITDSILKMNPLYDIALRNKGLTLIYLKRYREAIIVLNLALKLNPKDSIARYYMGIVYAKIGNNKRAVSFLTDNLR